MIQQLEIDRTKNTATLCWKATPKGGVKVEQPPAGIMLDEGDVIIIHVPAHHTSLPAYQLWLINEWYIMEDDFDVYYRPDFYDEQREPPKRWLSFIHEHSEKLIDVFNDFRPKNNKSFLFETLDPRRKEIEARANPRYY